MTLSMEKNMEEGNTIQKVALNIKELTQMDLEMVWELSIILTTPFTTKAKCSRIFLTAMVVPMWKAKKLKALGLKELTLRNSLDNDLISLNLIY